MKQQPVCDDKTLLIAYLYGECDAVERQLVEEHLARCANCAAEMGELRGVRNTLREWAPPDQALGFRIVREAQSVTSEVRSPRPEAGRRMPHWVWPRVFGRGPQRGSHVGVPVWAQVAAAVLVLAVGAGIANLDVRMGSGGVTIRTGWQKAPIAQQAAAPSAQTAAPWRADLEALAQQLRREISAIPVSTAPPVGGAAAGSASAGSELSLADRAAVVRQLQPIIESIAERQQRQVDQQIAERFLRLARDVDTQRVADQRRFLQGLNQIDLRTSQLSQVQNYLLRVANVQEIK